MKNVIFITGATGTIGSALVPLLARDKNVNQIVLLVRAHNDTQLAERGEELRQYWKLKSLGKISLMAGDVTKKNLGLSKSNHAFLKKNLTHVIHAAGQVKLNLPIEEARRHAGQAAVQILELCHKSPRFKKLEYVSTIGVAGRMTGAVPESHINVKRSFHNTYEQAKAEAEDLIFIEMRKGLQATIHRPSMVVGDSKTGQVIHFQVFYHLAPFLAGLKTHGFLPEFGHFRLDLVPSDYVARALQMASKDPKTAGRVFHLCSGPDASLSLLELSRWLQDFYRQRGVQPKPLKSVPLKWVKAGLPLAALLSGSKGGRMVKNLGYFLEYLQTEQQFTNIETRAYFEGRKLAAPAVLAYLVRILDYARRDNQL